jgi:hypothetical protein
MLLGKTFHYSLFAVILISIALNRRTQAGEERGSKPNSTNSKRWESISSRTDCRIPVGRSTIW